MKPVIRQPSARELRRAKRRAVSEPPPIPMLLRMQYVLAPLERILDDIERTQHVTTADGQPVFDLPNESAQHIYPMVPAIEGIVDFYEMYWVRRDQNKTLPGLRQLAKRLQYSMPLTERETAAARADMAAMRAIVPILSPSEAADLLLQTQIKAEMEALQS